MWHLIVDRLARLFECGLMVSGSVSRCLRNSMDGSGERRYKTNSQLSKGSIEIKITHKMQNVLDVNECVNIQRETDIRSCHARSHNIQSTSDSMEF